jgi:hypothetical protein
MEGSFDFTENAGKVLTDAIGAAVDSGSRVPVLARVVEGDPARALAPSSWWAAAGTAVSPRRCSARSASTACITRSARRRDPQQNMHLPSEVVLLSGVPSTVTMPS